LGRYKALAALAPFISWIAILLAPLVVFLIQNFSNKTVL